MGKRETFQKGLAILLLGFILFAVGCSSTPTKSQPQDDHITTIETVLGHLLNGPDLELIELLDSPENNTIIGKDEESLNQYPESPTELEKYLKKKYKPYFRQSVYDRYINIYVLPFQTSAYLNDYEMGIKRLEIKEDETTNDAYDFTVNVALTKAGETTISEVSGRVNINDEDEIARFKLNDANQLIKALNGEVD